MEDNLPEVPYKFHGLARSTESTRALHIYRDFVNQTSLDEIKPSLEIDGFQLPRQVLDLLYDVLESNDFKYILLRNNGGGQGIISFDLEAGLCKDVP